MENNTLRAKVALRGICVAAVMTERLMDREVWGSYIPSFLLLAYCFGVVPYSFLKQRPK